MESDFAGMFLDLVESTGYDVDPDTGAVRVYRHADVAELLRDERLWSQEVVGQIADVPLTFFPDLFAV